MEVLGEPCASFREIKAISSKLTIYLLYFVYFFTLGNFGQIWGRTVIWNIWQMRFRLMQMVAKWSSDITDYQMVLEK